MDIKLIKQLREETGYGMLDVKEALIKASGNIDDARTYLSTLKKEVSLNQRVASKGLTSVHTFGDEAILYEINGETDFIAKHEAFIKLMDFLKNPLIKSKAVTVKQALLVEIDNKTVKDYIDEVSLITQEHLTLRRFFRINKDPSHIFTTYKHLHGKLSILLITKDDHALNYDLALHITSHAPKYLAFETLDHDTIMYEKMMYQKEHTIHDDVSFKTHLQSLCLYNQPFIKNPNILILALIPALHVIDFYRFELGQGIDNKLNCRLDIPCDGSKMTVTPM